MALLALWPRPHRLVGQIQTTISQCLANSGNSAGVFNYVGMGSRLHGTAACAAHAHKSTRKRAIRTPRHFTNRTMSTPHERLKAARKAAGFATATDAAAALSISKDTYHQHERGTRDYDDDRALQYARRFRTTPEYLKFGRGPSKSEPMARIIGRVGANPDDSVVMTTAHDSWDMAPIPPGGSNDSVALEVDGGSMRGVADDGSLIYFEYQQTPPTPDMHGQVVVCEVEGGRVLVKRLLKGSRKGLYDLQSLFGPLLEDQKVLWAAHISAIVPPYFARRIIRRAGEAA